MKFFFRILKWLLSVLLILTILSIAAPAFVASVLERMEFDNTQWVNIIAIADIFVALMIAVYSSWEHHQEKNSCQYAFSIADNSLSFDHYLSFNNDGNTFRYSFDSDISGAKPPHNAYFVDLEKEAVAGVNIPLLMKINMCPPAKRIKFTNLSLRICTGKGCINYRTNEIIADFETAITGGVKFIVRLILRCKHELEQELESSRMFIGFKVKLVSEAGKRYVKYYQIEIQNVQGKMIVLSTSAADNYLSNWFKRIRRNLYYNSLCRRYNGSNIEDPPS